MSKDTQYAIITTFKQWYCLSDWFKYYVENIKLRLKILLYRLTKPSKQEKYKMLLCTLEGKDRRYETVNGKEVPIVGHRQLELSLLRGFDTLSVRYGFDCLADNMIVLWANKIDLCVLNRLKKQKKIKKVVTVPTACQYDYKDLMRNFPCYECIDYSLVASDRVLEQNKTYVDAKYHSKIKTWASGVELAAKDRNEKINNACICYFKKVPVDTELVNYIKNLGIKCYVLEYTKYDFDYWLNLLKKTDFVIFCQECKETQGLAIAEAWAHNRPTLLQKDCCPYLTAQTGLFWDNFEALKACIVEYSKNPQVFLGRFSPYDWVEENMSDVVSAKNLVKIFSE